VQWYGDARIPALHARQVRAAQLNGAVVFAVNCYLADQVSPMLDAFLSAGASYVIAAPGENFAGEKTTFGAGTLGLWFRRLVERGVRPVSALGLAKNAVRLEALLPGRRSAAKDTLEFRAFYRGQMMTS
jgi:hypothetical protein